VVNGAKYMAIKNEEGRREYHRNYKRKQRAKLKQLTPLPGEEAALKALDAGDVETYDKLAASSAG
jgi:hypothetical protein